MKMQDLGYNYRITDFQCALKISQVSKLPFWIKKRREIAKLYDSYFKDSKIIIPLNKNAITAMHTIYMLLK